MKVIILGGGAVGALVAQRLIRERNEVTIVETGGDRCSQLEIMLDARIVNGSASSVKTLEKAGLMTADMLIAVTSSDEVNILGCLIAQAYSNIRIKVLRLRTHEVDRWKAICDSKLLGVDLIIHPDRETADRILDVVDLPGVSDITQFADGKVRLFGMTVSPGSPLDGKPLADLENEKTPVNALIVMVFRGNRVIIPAGKDYLRAGDHIYVVCPSAELEKAFEFVGLQRVKNVQRVFILGGKQLGIEAALRLERLGIQVKLFERDLARCQMIAEMVHDAVVVHADGTDQKVLIDENVDGIDAYLALTGDDEVNIIASLLAKRLGAAKAIAMINRLDFLPMAQLLGINSIFSTRLIVVDRILQFVRKGHVLSVTTFREEEAEAIELIATPGSRFVGKTLADVHLPEGTLLGAIVRPNGEVVVPRGEDIIRADDRVIFFCLETLVPKLEKAFIF